MSHHSVSLFFQALLHAELIFQSLSKDKISNSGLSLDFPNACGTIFGMTDCGKSVNGSDLKNNIKFCRLLLLSSLEITVISLLLTIWGNVLNSGLEFLRRVSQLISAD